MTDRHGDDFQLTALTARCRAVIDDDARTEIAGFLRGRQNADGGFQDRSGGSDLYYTHFALEALHALDEPLPVADVRRYLDGQPVPDLDLVHLACFLRIGARLGLAEEFARHAAWLERWRTHDGGYTERPGAASASPYGCFLAALAYSSLQVPVPSLDSLRVCLFRLHAETTPQAAALTALRVVLAGAQDADLVHWLLDRGDPTGGFRATPRTPLPDLLSTAVALHALRVSGQSLADLREPCFSFICGHWHDTGGFCGPLADSTPDCEYTYYALLALGTLA